MCGKGGAGAGQCIWANEFEIGVLAERLNLAFLILDMQGCHRFVLENFGWIQILIKLRFGFNINKIRTDNFFILKALLLS